MNIFIRKLKTQWNNQKITLTDLLRCSLFILICNLVGYFSHIFQYNSLRAWYPILEKSKLTPPNFVFPIVWTILFVLIGISTCISYKNANKENKVFVLFIFIMQLLFSFLWIILFFWLRNPLMGFVEILFFLYIIIKMMSIYKNSSLIGYLLLYPYLLWVSFAAYLNLIIILKN